MRSTLLAYVLMVGCATDVDVDETNLVEQDVNSTNGTSLNGTSLNGTSLNGTSLNGTSLNGTSLNGTSLNGTTLSAVSTTAPPLTGTAPVGSTWNATASNGAAVKLRIDSAAQGTGTNADLWFYGVSYQTSTTWNPLCGTGVLAVPVAGVWGTAASYSPSTTQFTFACRGKSIAKCVELGYKTYKGYTNQMAACVRLLRADYCGTGVSYTVDGTLLNLYDNLNIQTDTQLWITEAEWLPTGARCITDRGRLRFQQQGIAIPSCINNLTADIKCGRSFATGALIIDELP